MSSQGASAHNYSFIPSKSQLTRSNPQKYAPSVQGTQGLQSDKPANFKKMFSIPLMILCQVLLVIHFALFCTDFVPNMYIISGIYVTVVSRISDAIYYVRFGFY